MHACFYMQTVCNIQTKNIFMHFELKNIKKVYLIQKYNYKMKYYIDYTIYYLKFCCYFRIIID